MAHIPDGLLSPAVLAGTAALSAAALAVAARRSGSELDDRQAPLLGAATAFVFAAQMFNFPIGAGTSAHLLGGVLIAVVVGPWAGMLALFSVVLVQALLFQDGGIAALGANTFNLAVLGAGGGYLIYRWQLALTGDGTRRRLAAAGTAAFAAALATGVAVGLQSGVSDLVPLDTAILAVGGAHILVGVAEAGLTVAVLAMVLRARPDLVRDVATGPTQRVTAVAAGAAVLVGVAAAVWGSGQPDAFEAAVHALGLAEGHALFSAPFADYQAPGGAWVAAILGVIVAFGAAWLLFRAARRTPA